MGHNKNKGMIFLERLQKENPNMAMNVAVIIERGYIREVRWQSAEKWGRYPCDGWLRAHTWFARWRVPEIKSWNSRADGPRSGLGGAGNQIGRRDSGKEVTEQRHPLCLAPHREKVMGQMEFSLIRCFSGRLGSHVVYPDTAWWHSECDVPYLLRFLTLYKAQLHCQEVL